MRLAVKKDRALLVRTGVMLSFGFAVAACGSIGGIAGNNAQIERAPLADRTGPAGDYPVVIGDPFTIDGITYTPSDTLNYDEVGYVAADSTGSSGITIAHRTLPLPSYVEVTSLDTGRTMLARVERRGPMVNSRLVALSGAAMAQLGATEGTPVRVRRVNPPEAQRAELRSGGEAFLRMDTPSGLLDVLKRRLPSIGSASLRREDGAPDGMPSNDGESGEGSAIAVLSPASLPNQSTPSAPIVEAPIVAVDPTQAAAPTGVQTGVIVPVPDFPTAETVNLPPPIPEPLPAAVATAPITTVPGATEAENMGDSGLSDIPNEAADISMSDAEMQPEPAKAGDFVVQAGAFSAKSTAERVARDIDGYVEPTGRLWRVRAGPYESRGQANEALAKVRGAGYKGAQVYKLR